MIEETISKTRCKIIVYFNSDILFHKHVIELIDNLSSHNSYKRKILIAGKRGDIYWNRITKCFNHNMIWRKCKLHSGSGIDYFIFTRYTFNHNDRIILGEIVVGRIRYDNIILSLALKNSDSIVIDSTEYVKAIHLSILQKEKNELIKVFINKNIIFSRIKNKMTTSIIALL